MKKRMKEVLIFLVWKVSAGIELSYPRTWNNITYLSKGGAGMGGMPGGGMGGMPGGMPGGMGGMPGGMGGMPGGMGGMDMEALMKQMQGMGGMPGGDEPVNDDVDGDSDDDLPDLEDV